MRKFTQNLLLLTATSLFIFSCGADEEPVTPNEPTVSVSATSGVDANSTASLANGGSVPQGDSVYLSVSFTAPGGFDNLRVGSSIFDASNSNLENGSTSGSISFFQTTSPATVGSTISSQFVIVDDIGQTDTAIFEYTIDEPRSPAVQSSTQILIGGFQNSTLGSFYDAVEDSVYTSANALMNDEKIDFLFYYSTAALYTIAALDNDEADATIEIQTGGDLDNFDPQNPTRFSTFLTAPDFDAVTNLAELTEAFEGDKDLAGESRITMLEEGDIFAFVLPTSRGNKIGLVKVTATTGSSGSDRAIEIEVKIEP